jgi:hypothetical protein
MDVLVGTALQGGPGLLRFSRTLPYRSSSTVSAWSPQDRTIF